MPAPFQQNATVLNLSPRLFKTSTVVGSPALAAETIIGSVSIPTDIALEAGAFLFGFAAYTVGASGSAGTLRIRRTDASGTIVKSSGALTHTAAALYAPSILAFDSGAVAPGQVYVLTLQVTAGAAESTVSGVTLVALAV